MKALNWIVRRMCSHPSAQQIRKMEDGRMYLECLKCGDTSPGVQVVPMGRTA